MRSCKKRKYVLNKEGFSTREAISSLDITVPSSDTGKNTPSTHILLPYSTELNHGEVYLQDIANDLITLKTILDEQDREE